eukprot:Amastigsp_a847374_24.p4 type:complete len:122 gc:universal Amastigsp_a847374_24:3018-2653(-)
MTSSKVSRERMSTSTSLYARTDAVRLQFMKSAISPKNVPSLIWTVSLVGSSTTTTPRVRKYMQLPSSPSRMTYCPAAKCCGFIRSIISTMNDASIVSRSRSSPPVSAMNCGADCGRSADIA